MPRFDLQGHRGARGLAPENTLAGFRTALALGVNSIELDVVLAADGIAVVHHDLALNPDLARIGGRWLGTPVPVGGMDAEALTAVDVGRPRPGSAYDARFPRLAPVDGACIPRLSEVCDLLAGTGVWLDAEIKIASGAGREEAWAAADAVLGVLSRAPAALSWSVRSFDWRVLRRVAQGRPGTRLGWLTDEGGAGPEAVAQEWRAAGGCPDPIWAPWHGGLDAARVARAHEAGLRVIPWTVNGADDMRRLIALGVDGMCTDYPDVARLVAPEGAV